MTIDLYFNRSEDNYIRKTIAGVITSLRGTLKDNMSVMSPEVTVEMDLADFKARAKTDTGEMANYAYIRELQRYYFIRDVVSVRTNLLTIKMEEDVLYTYQDDIYKISGITDRSEKLANQYLRDGEYSLNSFPDIQIQKFTPVNTGLDVSTPILVLGGIS